MSWSWGDFCPCTGSGGVTPTPPPTPVPVPVVLGDPEYHDVVAEALDRLPQQFKDKIP